MASRLPDAVGPVRRRSLLAAATTAPVWTLAACGDEGEEERTVRTPERLVYGDDPSQYAELTRPAGTPRGVVVVIHGGFWKATYDASLGRPLAAALADQGWAALNIEYRRVGNGGGFPATFDDVSSAIDLLAEADLDLATVLTLGHSAGGHLAVWAAARRRLEPWASARVPVTGAVSQAGVLDLGAAYADDLGSGAVRALLGAGPEDGERFALTDPVRQVPVGVPVRCVHGRADDVVPPSQSESYVAAARAAGADASVTWVDGDHFVVIDVDSPVWRVQLDLLTELAATRPEGGPTRPTESAESGDSDESVDSGGSGDPAGSVDSGESGAFAGSAGGS